MSSVAQRAFGRGEVGPDIWGRADLEAWHAGLEICENIVVLKAGILSARGGTRFVGEVKNSSQQSRLVPFEASPQQSFMIEIANGKARFYRDAGIVEIDPGVAYEINTPWVTAQLQSLWYAQSVDVLFVTHGDVRPTEIRRYANTDWRVANYAFEKGPFNDLNGDKGKTISIAAVAGAVLATCTGFSFTAADVGKLLYLEESDKSSTPKWVGNVTVAVGDKVNVFGNTYECVDGTKTGVNPPDHLEGQQKSEVGAGGCTWLYLHSGYGIGQIVEVGAGTATINVITRMPDQLTSVASWRWALSPWSNANGWPAIADFHEGRFFLAASKSRPATIWASRSDDFNNHQAGSDGADALNLTLAQRQLNAIRWIATGRVLGVGTSGREWTVSPSSLNEVLTPTNRKGTPASGEGSSAIRPVETDNAIVFVSASGDRLHEYAYSFQEDAYVAPDLSILASHIGLRGFTRLAWDRDPNRIIWALLADGGLAGMTYRRDQGLAAWHRHPMTNGFVEDIATMWAPDGKSTQLWLIVRRVIDGQVKRYIEVMQPVFNGTGKTDAADSWQLDCALRYEGAPATEISGLDHLEGQTVSILADGTVQPPQEVTGGKIILVRPFSKVLVGLPFTPYARSLGLDVDTAAGAMTGKKKRFSHISVRALNTVGGEAGVPDELDLLSPSAGLTMDDAPKLWSGVKEVTPLGGWEDIAQIVLRQPQPLPFCIQVITPEFEVED